MFTSSRYLIWHLVIYLVGEILFLSGKSQVILLLKLSDFCVNHGYNTKPNLQVSTIVSCDKNGCIYLFFFSFTETTIAVVPKENGEAVKRRKIFTMHYMSNLCSRKQQLTETLVTKNVISVSLYKTSTLL